MRQMTHLEGDSRHEHVYLGSGLLANPLHAPQRPAQGETADLLAPEVVAVRQARRAYAETQALAASTLAVGIFEVAVRQAAAFNARTPR